MVWTLAPKPRRIALAGTALAGSLTLSACLGSGSGNFSFGAFPGDGFREGGGGLPIVDYESDPEYLAMGGLSLIGASTVYNGGTNPVGYTGSGIIVAVIDTGIDIDHPEFFDAQHAGSVSVVGGSVDDVGGHGTAVAGVIGANRDGVGMHGVAFNSTILTVRADFPGSCPAFCGFADADLAAATNVAVFHGASIVNYSLGGNTPGDPVFRDALVAAVASDTVLVVAAGNDGLAEASYPARYAPDADINGQMIVAGAYDQSIGDIASFSNLAGVTADFYLMAPGVDVFTTAVGGGYAPVSGTSFSAPYISGAAAILKERFPALTAAQIVDILLVSATDLGPVGTDTTYGRGLLNLAAAASPLGVLAIPSGATVDSGGWNPDDAVLTLGAAFGDVLGGSSVLADAMFLDGYDRPYDIDLTAGVSAARSGPDLLGYVSGDDGLERIETALTRGTFIRIVRADDGIERPTVWHGAAFDENDSDASFSLRHSIAPGADLTLAQGEGTGGLFGLYGAGAPSGGMLGPGDTAFIGMADKGGNATVSKSLTGDLTLRVGVGVNRALLGDDENIGTDDSAVYVAEMSHTAESGARLGVQLGRLVEDGGVLTSGGDGGFAVDGSATTDFASAFGVVPLTDRIDLFGSYTAGQTDAGSLSAGLIGDFDGLRSESFSLGIATRELFTDGDRLSVTLVRPLRVTDGTVTVTAPLSRTLEGEIVYGQESLGLAPSGRETDAEMTYGLAVAPGQQLDFSLVARIEPDHVQDAPTEYNAGIRYRLNF